MKAENAAYLFGGFAFGILFGFAVVTVFNNQPDLDSHGMAGVAAGPAGPMAPTQTGSAGSAVGAAPMMARIQELRGAIRDDPRDVASLSELAHLYHDVGMWEQAIGYYEQAVEVEPDDPNLLTDLGICYRRNGDPERALALFARAHEADPQHWESLFNTVVVAGFDLSRFDAARAALETMEAMTPKPPRLDELRQALEESAAGQGDRS